MKEIILAILFSIILGFAALGLLLTIFPPPTDTKVKLCTIKLNDSNHASSYLTGECAE